MAQLDENRKWTQDEIINNTKNVVRGLETLKSEHSSLLTNLNLQDNKNTEIEEAKAGLVQESLEKLELGLGEAQVNISTILLIFDLHFGCIYESKHFKCLNLGSTDFFSHEVGLEARNSISHKNYTLLFSKMAHNTSIYLLEI